VLVYAATKNSGKLDELRAIFSAAGWRVEESARYADVAEGTLGYAENAALKARALYATLVADGEPAPVLADDSGLEVAALGNRPGVLSARYGGEGATWRERRTAVLRDVAASRSADRSARFVCALHFITADGAEFANIGALAGTLAERERGDSGFSYDAIFIAAGSPRTLAELPAREKNLVSARFRAARELLEAVGPSVGKDSRTGM